MSYVRGESDLPEAPEKWKCTECGSITSVPLEAPHPFMPDEPITGCPNCLEANSLAGACQFPGGCHEFSSSGTPGGYGFRYIWTCSKHHPRQAGLKTGGEG